MQTQLKLVFEQQYGKTAISDCFFTSPLKVGTPHSESDVFKVILMMASAGVLSGDNFTFDITCKDGTKAELTEQSYTKIFDCSGGGAAKKMSIKLDKNASFYYHPCPVIPFKNSYFDSESIIHLEKTSAFACSEIFANGRVAMGEQFAFRHFRNKVTVYVDDSPVFMEHNFFEPEHQKLNGIFNFDGYTHQGSFYCYTSDETVMDRLYNFETEKSREFMSGIYSINDNPHAEVLYGISRAKAGIVCKSLANNAQDIEDFFHLMQNIFFG